MSNKPVLYEFAGSVWANAPKIAITEVGLQPSDVEFRSVNLPEGQNFDPNGYLKVNRDATVPALVVGDKKFVDSTTVVDEIFKLGPDAPKHDSHTFHELEKIIHAVHSPKHDPNALLLLPTDDADLEAKKKGVPGGFIAGRQKALDQFAPAASGEFKTFLEKKQKENGALHKLYQDSDAAYRAPFYQNANDQWKSAGEFIRGDLTHILRKTPGTFLGGAKRPGAADIHLITWLARIVTDAGAPPGQVSGVAIGAVQKKTGGQEIDPVVAGYWDSWIVRDSFKNNNVH